MESASQETMITIGVEGTDGREYIVPDVTIHMASMRNPEWNFVDEGDEVELCVVFAKGLTGIPWTEPSTSSEETEDAVEVHLANQIVPLVPIIPIEKTTSRIYKAVATVLSTGAQRLNVGEPVPFTLQYRNANGILCESKSVTPPNKEVYYHPVWKKLRERNASLKKEIRDSMIATSSNRSSINEDDEYDFLNKEQLTDSFSRSHTPVKLAQDDFFLYYTRKACSPFLQSKNIFLRVIKELMVTPLTNFTGLSLYYQLYLVEIFHVKFYTKAGHYLCMPVIVLLMATWFAQWRFIGYYTVEDFSILILNGTAVFLFALQAWYIVWGFLYRMYLFGMFMVWPLIVIYILANMMFQLIVINSMWVIDSKLSLHDVTSKWGQNSTHWYDFITLQHFGVVWYFHPLVWALVFSFVQAFFHICEDKLPPRVSQTSHWLDLTTVLKKNGYVATAVICLSQTFFGTLNEFCASPRLLPLLLLRICYTMGYEEKVWLKFRFLVEDCLRYGNPAIDYIGRGGSKMPRLPKSLDNPDELEKTCKEIGRGLCENQKECLTDEKFLQDPERFTPLLQHYVWLNHRLTKYRIQVHAYGPFTPKGGGDPMADNVRMENDFPDNASFRIFLGEVRSLFAEMEWEFVNECKLSRI